MKYILFFFNIIFFITGAAILGVGIWLKVDPNASNILSVVNLNDGGRLMDVAIYVLIGVGAFIFLVGFLGCCGACRESSCMLCTYAGLLVIVFMGEIVVAVMAIVFKNRISDGLKDNMKVQVEKAIVDDPKNAITIVWNSMQHGLKCCGSVNATDYLQNANLSNTIPQTCCKMASFKVEDPTADNYVVCKAEFDSYKGGSTAKFEHLQPNGCYSSIFDWVNKHTGILIGIGFGIAVIQLFGIIFACCVRSQINKGEYA